jgi:cytoskeletal protein RodZ
MPPTLGQRLKHAREARQLALMDVAHQTRIPVSRIKDLEDDNYTSFGSLTYAKSFLKAYSELLSVNANEVLSHLHTPTLGGSRDYRYLVEDHGLWIDDDSNRPAMMPSRKSVRAPRSLLVAAGVSLFFLVAGVSILWANHYLQKTPNVQADAITARNETILKKVSGEEPLSDEFEVTTVQITSDQASSNDPATVPRAVPVFDTPPRPEIIR